MRGWCWCLVLLQLAGDVVLDSHPDRQLLCECTTTHCRSENTSTCYSQYKCFTQYLKKTDGSHPVTRGCVQSVTPILCENRRPEVRIRINWPYLKCCDSGDLCNSAVMSTPPSWASSTTSVSRVDQDSNGRKRNRHLLCECNIAHCRTINRSTCHTNYKCYTLYVLDSSEEGRMLTTRGCAEDNNGNLCDGRNASGRYRGSFVRCCNTGDLCNSAVMSTPASWDSHSITTTTTTTEKEVRLNASTQANSTSTPRTEVGSSLVALWLRNSERAIAGSAWPVSKPAVLAVLCVGLFLLIGIMAFGFYILKVQSNYLAQLRRGYARANEEEPLAVVSSPYHMSLLPSNSEQNNNSKSGET